MNAIIKQAEKHWLDVLREETQKPGKSQKTVAYELGYSPAVVNQVLKGTYKGSLTAVEQAVRGAFMQETVQCPVYGELEAHRCIGYQRLPYSNANATRVRLFKACRTCRHNQQQR